MDDLIQQFVEDYPALAEHFPYLLVFTLLYFCGLGLPVPEEVSLLGGGYLIYLRGLDQPGVDMTWQLVRMIATACAAILGGDFTMYWLGRHHGEAFLSHRWMRWVFSRQNRRRIDRFYDAWGHWTVFFSRFVPGIRVGSFFLAGASGVKARTFLLMDGLGTAVSAPISVWVAFHFGEKIDYGIELMGTAFQQLVYVIALGALSALWWQIRKARRAAATSKGSSGTSPG